MRYLVLSDIHGNWDALETVLADAQGQYDQVLCCGDIVGYGADPNLVTDWCRTHVAHCVRGNHDKACTGSADLAWFNEPAQRSALWTMRTLTPENTAYLRALPRGPVKLGRFQILHGSVLDEDEYISNAIEAKSVSFYSDVPVTFFGHTHLQGGFASDRQSTQTLYRPSRDERELLLELSDLREYLINPGSVGQPRDYDPRAAYSLFDPEGRTVVYRRVPYDIEAQQKKILKAGLPEGHAMRLEFGK